MDKVVRHTLADRIFHWVLAAAVLVLLGTAFLPILGWQFPWITAHWIAGSVLIFAVLFHVLRAIFWQDMKSMWIGAADLRDAITIARRSLRRAESPPPRPGKYSFAQKLIHHMFAVVVLLTCVTGGLMMVKIDTPWWERNLYLLEDGTWGLIYVLHGLAALFLITMIISHVYFALRPEKLFFTRSMVLGWITREEYGSYHDPQRWQINK